VGRLLCALFGHPDKRAADWSGGSGGTWIKSYACPRCGARVRRIVGRRPL